MRPLSVVRSEIRLCSRKRLVKAMEADAAIGRKEQLCG